MHSGRRIRRAFKSNRLLVQYSNVMSVFIARNATKQIHNVRRVVY